jgi:signal transduction histidine kinase
MALLFSKRFSLDECVEQTFFKTIIIISLFGCVVVTLMEVWMLRKVDTQVHLLILLIEILLLTLYGISRIDLDKITTLAILLMCALFTYRGFITTVFLETTYTLLITIGFISALVSRRKTKVVLISIVLGCLVTLLFKDYRSVDIMILLRKAIPYLLVFFIVTICSGVLKSRYERTQVRLRAMVELLDRKNRKISAQHLLLKKNYNELEALNANLELIIGQKTEKITEKNKQLATAAYTNAHTIRAPLARILGLLNLVNLDPRNREFYLDKINSEATDMDAILLMVTKQIELNIHK